jgi:hypothetical protein
MTITHVQSQSRATTNKSTKKRNGAVLRTFFIAVCIAACAATALSQEHSATQKILRKDAHSGELYFDAQAREAIPPGVLTIDKFSATSIGDVLTLLFDSAKVDLQTQNDALIGTWVGTVRVPTQAGAKPKTSYLQHLRASVDKTEGTRVVLVVDVGGKTFTTEFPYGTTHHGNITRQIISPVRKETSSYTATFLIIAERRDPTGAVLVTIDGLDVDAKSGNKAKKK